MLRTIVYISCLILFFNQSSASSLSVFEIIKSDSELSEFAKYLKKSGIDQILNKKLSWNWTVFAPDNNAFKNLKNKNSSMLEDDIYLKNIILDHILASSKSSKNLNSAIVIEQTISNKPLQLYKSDDIHVKDMVVINEDISATNGIVHRIGCVMYVQPSKDDNRLTLEQKKNYSITSCCMRTNKEINEWKATIMAR